jgi:hypothetical protein
MTVYVMKGLKMDNLEEIRNTYRGWIKAFEIFNKYEPDANGVVQPAHDIVYSGCNPDLVSKEDKKILDMLGWMIEDELECFSKFT